MTELIAYRYRQRTADGMHITNWTEWQSGRLRGEMMAELMEVGKRNLIIVQCCVPRGETDPINGRFNDLWVWTPARGWKKSNARNWFVDSCDPTQRLDDEDPFTHYVEPERLAYWRRKLYGTDGIQPITDAITADEMATE